MEKSKDIPLRELRDRSVIVQMPIPAEQDSSVPISSEPAVPEPAHLRYVRKLSYERREADTVESFVDQHAIPSGQESKAFYPDPEKVCTYLDCPINRVSKLQHQQGVYLHEGQGNDTRPNVKIFGISNPPPDIWQAYDISFGYVRLGTRHRLPVIDETEVHKVVLFALYHGVANDDYIATFEVEGFCKYTRAMKSTLKTAFRGENRKCKMVRRLLTR